MLLCLAAVKKYKGGDTELFDEKEYPAALRVQSGNTVCLPFLTALIRLADEIILLANGKLTDRGPADDIFPKLMGMTIANCNMLEVNQTC